MKANTPNDLIPAEEARRILGVGTKKMSQLIKERVLTLWEHPLDRRKKLISRAEAEALLLPRKVEAA